MPVRATFAGTVSPSDPGALVALQVAYGASGEYWRSVAFGRVGSDGSYSIAHAFRTPGEASVRTIVQARKLHMAAAISEPLAYVVGQTQNPQLTIQSSADPLAYGQSVTISGVAAGQANQPVTLLARAAGHFAVVATGTTDARGDYTFDQAPLQNTYYKVTDAAAESTMLFEGVSYALSPDPVADTVQAGQQLTFSGTLAPARVGQVVQLERQYPSGIGFHVVELTTVGDASDYTVVHAFDTVGANLMRIKVPGDDGHLSSTSVPFTIAVTR
jgi:hypothetical protein